MRVSWLNLYFRKISWVELKGNVQEHVKLSKEAIAVIQARNLKSRSGRGSRMERWGLSGLLRWHNRKTCWLTEDFKWKIKKATLLLPGLCLGGKEDDRVAKQAFKSTFSGFRLGTLSIKASLIVWFSKIRGKACYFFFQNYFLLFIFCWFKKKKSQRTLQVVFS